MTDITIDNVEQIGEFSFRWPDGIEHFESGWKYALRIQGSAYRVQHGIGQREVYGTLRLHTVTWLNGEVQVEGVESDDYPTSGALISRIRRPGRSLARMLDEVPEGYDGFEIVQHRSEIDAPYSPTCLAVKVAQDDLERWALHAWIRSGLPRKVTPGVPRRAAPSPIHPSLGAPPSPNPYAVAAALLAHGDRLAATLTANGAHFTSNDDANQLILNDPFAFLVAVVADMGIAAERAWALPYELQQRLGHLDPQRIAHDKAEVVTAVQQLPKLHRFVNLIPAWIVQAARIVVDEYQGDAARLWNDSPTATELRHRLERFSGIAQKKAAMAVEILERDLGVAIIDMTGSDVAFDVHLRRVLLRTGIADRDDVGVMIAAAQRLHPERPGALDFPAWDIGRRWCHPKEPDCPMCPLNSCCPRLIDRAAGVRGA